MQCVHLIADGVGYVFFGHTGHGHHAHDGFMPRQNNHGRQIAFAMAAQPLVILASPFFGRARTEIGDGGFGGNEGTAGASPDDDGLQIALAQFNGGGGTEDQQTVPTVAGGKTGGGRQCLTSGDGYLFFNHCQQPFPSNN